jgi:hypothetical protein
MAEYKNRYKDVFKWDNGTLKYITALLCVRTGKEIEPERLENIRKMIGESNKRFAPFRAFFEPVMAVLLSMEDEPQQVFDNVREIYELMKQEKVSDSAYTIAAAYYIAKNVAASKYLETVKNFKTLYKIIKKLHPIITGADDYINIAMMTVKDMEPWNTAARIEAASVRLMEHFGKGNNLQALASSIVAQNLDDEQLIDRVIALDSYLKERGCEMSGSLAVTSLSLLATLPYEPAYIGNRFLEMNSQIRLLDGYGTDYIDDVLCNSIATYFLVEGTSEFLGESLGFIVLITTCSSTTINI